MVVINCAYTEQINPSGASPILTKDQIWKGLQRKVRNAQDFVPVIESTDVLEDANDRVVRDAHFKSGFQGQPSRTVREEVKSYYPTKVDFWQPDGALITNTLSEGPGLTENDYHMTYTFEWRYPDVQEGSEEHRKLLKSSVEGAKMAVHSSIEAMRKMALAKELD